MAMTDDKKTADEILPGIEKFLSRQRRDILEKLYRNGRLSHKELAEQIGSTPTSLWNICRTFDNFSPPLITSEVSGRYKFYSLTDAAAPYMDAKYKKNAGTSKASSASSASIQKSELLQSRVKEAAEELAEHCGSNKWERALDDYFVNFYMNTPVFMQGEETYVIERMLNALKELILSDDQSGYNECLEAYFSNPILQSRLDDYLISFYSLDKLYRLMDDPEQIWNAYQLVDEVLNHQNDTAVCEKLHLMPEEYEQIRHTLLWLAEKEKGKDKKYIYDELYTIIKSTPSKVMALTERIYKYGS